MNDHQFIFQEWVPIIPRPPTNRLEDNDIETENVLTSVENKSIRNSVHLLSLAMRRNLLNARLKKMCTVSELAEEVGACKDDIIAYENGIDFPNAFMIQKLENVLSMKLTPL
jgi:ribosome-binding protein aMBF1 (putative translation factor)